MCEVESRFHPASVSNDHLPSIDLYFRGTPTGNNHLEIKGAGQAGAIGATQAVISALCDALGVTHIDMPATPAAIWGALQEKKMEGQNDV